MSKSKKPDYLKVPKLKKKELVEFIIEQPDCCRGGHDYGRHVRGHYARGWSFCWNVKLYHVDLSFENLLRIYKQQDPQQVHEDCPVWMERVKEAYDQNENHLFEWGVEDACRWLEGGKDGVPEDDGWNMLWDGTPVDVSFTFGGRSGGWLILTWFQGHLLSSDVNADTLMEWEYKTLCQFAEYLLMIRHMVDGAEEEVEYCTAGSFFSNICYGIKTREEDMEYCMSTDQTGEH